MVNVRVKKIGNRKYAYARYRDSKGRLHEEYLGPVKRTSNPTGVYCPRCGKKINEKSIRDGIVNQLKTARQTMWKEKRHLTDHARYEILGILIDSFEEFVK